LAEAGVELLADYHEVAVVGIAEVLHKIPSVVRVQRRLAREAVQRRASLAILVDSPGTHLGVARRLKKHGIRVGYFIGPQVWAWRSGRVRVVKRRVDRMVVIFPFEEKIYRDAGVPVDFVGHPLADVVKASMTRVEFLERHGLAADRPIVALLPGSRAGEVRRNFPAILAACKLLTVKAGKDSQPQFIHAAAPGFGLDPSMAAGDSGFTVKRIEGETYNALAAADCAIVASGTATVEAALMGTPFVMVYRVSPLTYALGKPRVKVPYFAMVNLIAEQEVVPELVQHKFTVENIVTELKKIIPEGEPRTRMIEHLAIVKQKLQHGSGEARPSDAAAEIILNMIG